MTDKSLAKADMRFVLLGAGQPFKGIEDGGIDRVAMRSIVLDWLLAAARQVTDKPQFVGGYDIDAVRQKYPELDFATNGDWSTTKASASLLVTDLASNRDLIVSYSDIIYREQLVLNLAESKADIAIAIDSDWLERFDGFVEAACHTELPWLGLMWHPERGKSFLDDSVFSFLFPAKDEKN